MAHRKAIRAVHPDKVSTQSVETQALATLVFDVLHEALKTFRKEEGC